MSLFQLLKPLDLATVVVGQHGVGNELQRRTYEGVSVAGETRPWCRTPELGDRR